MREEVELEEVIEIFEKLSNSIVKAPIKKFQFLFKTILLHTSEATSLQKNENAQLIIELIVEKIINNPRLSDKGDKLFQISEIFHCE